MLNEISFYCFSGFLKLGTDRTSRANFALIDQIAALVWINDNIAAFGGNQEEVTVMGHGTGAVSANLLMVSEMAHRDNQRMYWNFNKILKQISCLNHV